MPSAYFRQVPEKFRNDHIKAIAAVKDANMDLYLNLKAHLPDGRQVLTFIRPGTKAGTLLDMVTALPWKHNDKDYLPLTRLLVFSTKDESMSLNMFIYGTKKSVPGQFDQLQAGKFILDYAAQVQDGHVPGLPPNPLFEQDSMEAFLQRCSENYIKALIDDPRRFLSQRVLIDGVSGTEGTRVHIEEANATEFGTGHYWIDVDVDNSLPQVALENVCRLLFHHHFDVTRSRLDIVEDGSNGTVTVSGECCVEFDKLTSRFANTLVVSQIIRMLVTPVAGKMNTADTFGNLRRELKRAKWLDPITTDLVFKRYNHLSIPRAEIITAFGSLLHPIMAKENALAFSKANIIDTICNERFISHSEAIADLFADRFNPKEPLSDMDFELRCLELRQIIDSDVEDTVATELLLKMIDIVAHTLKTNLYMPDRYALGLRLDPIIMETAADNGRDQPFGVLFVHGRRFNGYHVRFRDIARGGLRLVTPPSLEQYSLESARHYDECYGLAFAQQLKNKDIPEGGSKAVCLVNTNGMGTGAKYFVMRKSVKAFTDTILDLIVQTEETEENIIDLLGRKEVLYLGPDEQIIPEDINWIIKRAAYRGYDTPNAFMSSKPRAGINHKEYGVTSEGVNVYLDVALRQVLGIDPKKNSFTIKMTGGPDGDVAGNELKILFREYGDNAKVVGIADASGCGEDPSGLDHEELLRLVREGRPIVDFDCSKLSHDGVVHKADNPEGIKARNSMHNRLKSDAFLPCGGRPNTIDITNYHNFISDGVPSSPLVVEGANLFITKEARKALFEEGGVAIVKDSSANKGGVITSSYEICGA
jgi:glutamate dehydrogenase